jgi:GDP-L-fucose synthase
MQNYSEYEHVNIGTGIDVTIKELAETVKKVTGYNGEIIFDITKPDGTPRKLLDVSKLNKLGWEYSINLEKGLNITYAAFQKEINDGTLRD